MKNSWMAACMALVMGAGVPAATYVSTVAEDGTELADKKKKKKDKKKRKKRRPAPRFV